MAPHPPPPPSYPQRLLNSAASTEEQTNKTPRGGERPPLGTGREKEVPRIDVRMTITERKRKDLMEWIELLIE